MNISSAEEMNSSEDFCENKIHMFFKALILKNCQILLTLVHLTTIISSEHFKGFLSCKKISCREREMLDDMWFKSGQLNNVSTELMKVHLESVSAVCICFNNFSGLKILLKEGLLPEIEDMFYALFKGREKIVKLFCEFFPTEKMNIFFRDNFQNSIGTPSTYLLKLFRRKSFWLSDSPFKKCLLHIIQAGGDFNGYLDNEALYLTFNTLVEMSSENDFALLASVVKYQKIDFSKTDFYGRRCLDFILDVDRICVKIIMFLVRSGFDLLQRKLRGKLNDKFY